MNEKEPQNPEVEHGPSPEQLASLAVQRNKDAELAGAREFLDAQQNAGPGVKRTFTTDAEKQAMADHVDAVVGVGEPKEEFHTEVPTMKMKSVYRSEAEKAEAASLLISSPPDTTKPGVADQLQKQMEQLYGSQES